MEAIKNNIKPLIRTVHKDFLHHTTIYGEMRHGASKCLSGDHSLLRGDCTGLGGLCSLLSGDCSWLRGDCSGLSGDCTGLRGDCTGLRGDLDEIGKNDRVEMPDLDYWTC